MGFVPLLKRLPGAALPLLPVRTQPLTEAGHLQHGKGPSLGLDHADILSLDLQPPEPREINFQCL